jgi:hypothetical protein
MMQPDTLLPKLVRGRRANSCPDADWFHLAAASQRIKPGGRRFETLQSSRESSSHKSLAVGPGLVQALPARSALNHTPRALERPA